MRYVLYITALLVFAVNGAVVISFFVQCRPAAKAWNMALHRTCWKFPTELDLALLQGCIYTAFEPIWVKV